MPLKVGPDGKLVNDDSPVKRTDAIDSDPRTIRTDKDDVVRTTVETSVNPTEQNATRESEKEMIARLEREATGKNVPIPTNHPTPATMTSDKKALLAQIQKTLKEFDNKESEIPLSNPYWYWLNVYRSMK